MAAPVERRTIALIAGLALGMAGCGTSSVVPRPSSGTAAASPTRSQTSASTVPGAVSPTPATETPSSTESLPPLTTAWAEVAAPSGPAVLNAIACAGASECWAVGSSGAGDLSASVPIIDAYQGNRWIAVSGVPAIAGGLNGVACAASDDCWAVGSGATGPLVMRYNGDTWAAVKTPGLSSEDGGLFGISCTGSSDCWAVGQGSAGSGAKQAVGPLLAHFDGSGWVAVSGPALPANDALLSAIACPAAGDCWAVGDAGDFSGLVEHLSNGVWAAVTSPDLAGSDQTGGTLDSISCASADQCWAVGGGPEAEGPPVIEQLSNGAWTVEPVAGTPSGSGNLSGIACQSWSDCWAVGFGASSNGITSPLQVADLVEHYAGGSWTPMSASPAFDNQQGDPYQYLQAVTCVASTCWTVGYASGGSGPVRPVIETASVSG